ncbi:copper-translocating P-type ATPase [Zalerion maritima]|uniref:Copper-translocating P-type ATPase n=1 Tax=Zalerion maritima TaxID=339359 RepID=A0AAD5RVZ2_9PEZI|nr:copper-translocating P-type ATPase [Zalerion maritima]
MDCGSGCCGPPKSPEGTGNAGDEKQQNRNPSPMPEANGDGFYEVPSTVSTEVEKSTCCNKTSGKLLEQPSPGSPSCSDSKPATKGNCCGPSPKPIDVECEKHCCSSYQEPCMAKKGGCCSPQPSANALPAEKKQCCASKTVDSGCKTACCSQLPSPGSEGKKGYCSPKPTELATEPDRSSNCCTPASTLGQAKANSCCPTKVPDSGCKSSCCPQPKAASNGDEGAPSCCRDKPSPCCDVSCLDRLALRACESEKPTVGSESTPTSDISIQASSSTSACRKGKGGKPCSHHTRTTRAKYGDTLEALGCICRALLALGQESCCISKEPAAIDRKACSKRRSLGLVSSGSSVDSCCATGVDLCGGGAIKPRTASNKALSSQAKAGSCAQGCCGKPIAPSIHDAASGADYCCGGDEPTIALGGTKEPSVRVKATTKDPEKGLSGREHIVLSISGMTCTGCETKLNRTLGTVDSVTNLKTSLVLARAEFDLDLAAGSLAEVMKHLERTTEFKCERVTSRGSNIDVVVPGNDSERFVKDQWPEGVTEMSVLDANTVRVSYDPKITGARDLIEKGWETLVELAPLRDDPTLEAGSKHVRHMGYMTVLSAVLTVPVLVMAWAPLPERELAYGSASLALATIVQVVIAGPFYPKALKALVFSKVIEMDLLIVLSTSAAYIFSVVSFGCLAAGKPLSTGQFFETSTLLVTLIMVGRFVAALARQKAVESISMRSLQASTAIIVDEAGDNEREVDVRLLQYGDIFKVAPDSRMPTDGTIVSGSSEVDESMITGESRPVEKYKKLAVIAGTINGSGTLIVRLTRLPGDNTINTIEAMVDEAKLSKPKIQNLADKVASYFVPVVVCLMIITLVIWIAVGVTARNQSGSEATIHAITYAITVLIVSCPCAIGLAVPMVIVIASGVAAEMGVIFKSAESIEVAYKTRHVVFDKTGTLTKGKLAVVAEHYFDGHKRGSSVSLLLGLIDSIKHPVSTAVATHLKGQGVVASRVPDPKVLTGKGVESKASSGNVIRAGNSRWLELSDEQHVKEVLSRGLTAFCCTVDGSLVAVFGLQDTLRDDAISTIAQLREQDISAHIISGDDDGAVRAAASQLGIPESNVRSRCSPADKQAYIQDLLATPMEPGNTTANKPPVVMFCGDGTNDAVALAQATVGVHMNEGGTDVAKSAADVVLMRPSLSGVLTVIGVSKKAVRRIIFNFTWSFVYNLFAILLGAGAFVRARIPPEYAGLGELVSVLPVIIAAVLLRWSKI